MRLTILKITQNEMLKHFKWSGSSQVINLFWTILYSCFPFYCLLNSPVWPTMLHFFVISWDIFYHFKTLDVKILRYFFLCLFFLEKLTFCQTQDENITLMNKMSSFVHEKRIKILRSHSVLLETCYYNGSKHYSHLIITNNATITFTSSDVAKFY